MPLQPKLTMQLSNGSIIGNQVVNWNPAIFQTQVELNHSQILAVANDPGFVILAECQPDEMIVPIKAHLIGDFRAGDYGVGGSAPVGGELEIVPQNFVDSDFWIMSENLTDSDYEGSLQAFFSPSWWWGNPSKSIAWIHFPYAQFDSEYANVDSNGAFSDEEYSWEASFNSSDSSGPGGQPWGLVMALDDVMTGGDFSNRMTIDFFYSLIKTDLLLGTWQDL